MTRINKNLALTLVEVMTGLAIIAFIASGVLLARARLSSQAQLARQKLQACAVIDELLASRYAGWTPTDKTPPASDQGQIAGENAQWRWTMQRLSEAAGEAATRAIKADVIIVELYMADSQENEAILTMRLPAAIVDPEDIEAEDTEETGGQQQ